MKCKYEQNYKNYIICSRDNSRRTKSCPCPNFKPRLWKNICNKIKTCLNKIKIWFKENW